MEFITNVSLEQLDTFSQNSEIGSIYQSSMWIKCKSNWDYVVCGVKIDGELVAVSLILIRDIKFGFKFAYSPRGVICDVKNTKVLGFILEKMRLYCRSKKVLLLKIDPNTKLKSIDFVDKEIVKDVSDDESVKFYKQYKYHHNGYNLGIKDTIQPRIQLSLPLNDYDNIIPKKTLKKVRASFNKGVIINEVSHDKIDILIDMLHSTENRHQIKLRNKQYFDEMLKAFGDLAHIYVGYLDDLPISAVLVVEFSNCAELLYSGYLDEYKHTNSTYPLRYTAIQKASERGCSEFNFGGVAGTLDDGLTMFKSAFNPLIDVRIGEFNAYTYPILSFMSSYAFRKIR